MGDQGKHGIAWTETTWSPVTGCTRVSPGCRFCYAERLAAGRLAHTDRYAGTTRNGRWTGQVNLHGDLIQQPYAWRKPRLVFVCSMSDLFHEAVPDRFLDDVFITMWAVQRHTFQCLTKRPERMADYICSSETRTRIAAKLGYSELKIWPLPNVWLGTSVEDQQRADDRIPFLLQTLAAVRWLSVEPLLEHIDLRANWNWAFDEQYIPQGWQPDLKGNQIAWVVVGGESGPGARPMDVDWARSLRDQCHEVGVAFFMKQMGSVWARENKSHWPDGRRDSKGACMDNWDEDLRIREWPAGFVPPKKDVSDEE